MTRTITTLVAGLLVAGGLAGIGPRLAAGELSSWSQPATAQAPLAALSGATGWLNSPVLRPEDLRGKVVLVDFWTYSCINCLRTLPYVKAWAEKYKSSGLVVIGVHTPEFAFEKMPSNVKQAVDQLGIDYPVALDASNAVWDAFGNRAWPALYFVDRNGQLRQRQYGEGRYAEAEQLIQRLLKEAGAAAVPTGLVTPQGAGTQAAPSGMRAGSEETYLGIARAEGFVSAGGGYRFAKDHAWPVTTGLRSNEWTLAGTWTTEAEYVLGRQPGARLLYRFRARDLHLVMGTEGQAPVRFRVRIDGKPPGDDHGSDVDAQGFGTVTSHRLYQLVRQKGSPVERTFELEVLEPGLRAYAFTFG